MSTVKNNPLPIAEIEVRDSVFATDFSENVFPLSKRQNFRGIYGEKLLTSPSFLDSPRQFI
jgi:hypothetical protein